MRIAIIGGGITGLTAAYDLLKRRYDVTLFEKSKLGGLAGCFKLDDIFLEKYYHHFFSNDHPLLALIDELELKEKLTWQETKMGFFFQNKIYSFGTPFDLLKFAPLSFFNRLKFGFSVLYFQKLNSWQKLEHITIEEWFTKHVSKEVYKVIWEPLLRAKFGEEYRNISAAWIWGRIHPRSQSREKGKEKLGYIEGSTQMLVDALRIKIEEMGGEIKTNTRVTQIVSECQQIKGLTVKNDFYSFDRVIATVPLPGFLAIVPDAPKETREPLTRIKYQGIICLILILNQPLSNIYWLNIGDFTIRFGGVIEHTNFISSEHYGGKHIVYLFNYVPITHPYFQFSKAELWQEYLPSLQRIFPKFKESWVDCIIMFKDYYGTPIYTLGYSEHKPAYTTSINGLYMANTAQIYPEDRNMSNCVSVARQVVGILDKE